MLCTTSNQIREYNNNIYTVHLRVHESGNIQYFSVGFFFLLLIYFASRTDFCPINIIINENENEMEESLTFEPDMNLQNDIIFFLSWFFDFFALTNSGDSADYYRYYLFIYIYIYGIVMSCIYTKNLLIFFSRAVFSSVNSPRRIHKYKYNHFPCQFHIRIKQYGLHTKLHYKAKIVGIFLLFLEIVQFCYDEATADSKKLFKIWSRTIGCFSANVSKLVRFDPLRH